MDKFEARLSDDEWACLEAIEKSEQAGCAEPHYAEDGAAPCSHEVVQRLRAAGLVEVVAALFLPLEMKRSVLRLTAEGKHKLTLRRNE